MDVFVIKLVSTALLPPGFIIILLFVGLVVFRWQRMVSVVCFSTAFACLYLLSTPGVAGMLMQQTEMSEPVVVDAGLKHRADAIVVLGGGLYHKAVEYGKEDTLSSNNFPRLRFAAKLHRGTQLPVLVTGGRVFGEGITEADLMRRMLVDEWNIPVRWTETKSRNTAENALESAKILMNSSISRILLVTHASHMQRALLEFERAGLVVTPAPVEFYGLNGSYPSILAWMPNASALMISRGALYEYIGRVWYRLRY